MMCCADGPYPRRVAGLVRQPSVDVETIEWSLQREAGAKADGADAERGKRENDEPRRHERRRERWRRAVLSTAEHKGREDGASAVRHVGGLMMELARGFVIRAARRKRNSGCRLRGASLQRMEWLTEAPRFRLGLGPVPGEGSTDGGQTCPVRAARSVYTRRTSPKLWI